MTVVIGEPGGEEAGRAGRDPTVVRAMVPDDLAALQAMVGRCSRETLFRRFHGFGPVAAYLERLFCHPGDVLLVAQAGTCVGFAVLAGDGEFGILVEDTWQRRGVGRKLVVEVLAAAAGAGRSSVRAEILSEDRVYVDLLARAGPVRARESWGVISVEVQLPGPSYGLSP